MAARVGLAFSTVRSIWQRHGLVPHRLRVFKLSADPVFVDKLHDVVGLYVNPPEHAVVLSVVEGCRWTRNLRFRRWDAHRHRLP